MIRYVVILFLLVHIGCTKTVYIPVESVRTEYRDNYLRDSIHVHDSIFIHMKSDTVYREKYRTIYKDIIRIDSIFKQDTIRVPYPVEKIVYKNKSSKFNIISYTLLIIVFIFSYLKFFR